MTPTTDRRTPIAVPYESVQRQPYDVGDARENQTHAPDHQPHLLTQSREPNEHYPNDNANNYRQQNNVVGNRGTGTRIIADAIPHPASCPARCDQSLGASTIVVAKSAGETISRTSKSLEQSISRCLIMGR